MAVRKDTMLTFSFACLVLFYAVSVLLFMLALRREAGKAVGDWYTVRGAVRALIIQLVLLVMSSLAMFSMARGQNMGSWTILIGLAVFTIPAAGSAYYYVSVFGDRVGNELFGTDAAPPPGAENPELDRARAAAARNDLAGAISLTEEYLAGHPDSLDALHYLAVLRLKSREYDRSADAARRALSVDAAIRATGTGHIEEVRADLLSLLADALERSGRAAEAAEVLEKSLGSLTVERYRRTLGERAARLRAR